jgi:hypothetical protein
MVRRPKGEVTYKGGVPVDYWRCQASVTDKAELFPRRCRKVRLRGRAFCEIHSRRQYVGEDTDVVVDQLDAVAQGLVPLLNRIADL